MKQVGTIFDIWEKSCEILTLSQKKWGIIICILSIIGSLFEMLGISMILPLVQVMMNPQQIRNIYVVDKLFETFNIITNYQMVMFIAVAVIFVYLIKNVYLSLLSYIRVKYSAKIQKELSVNMMKSYMNRGYSFFKTANTAELMRGISGSVGGMYNLIYNFLKIFSELFTMVCICIYIVFTDWKMAIAVLCLGVVCLILIVKVFRKMMKESGEKYYYYMALTNKYALQAFNGIKEVLVLNRRKYFTKNYEDVYERQQKGLVKQTVAMEIPAYLIEGVCISGLIMMVCLRINKIENFAIYIPQLATFAVAAFRILPSIGRLSSCINVCIFNIPSVQEVYSNMMEAKKYESCYGLEEKKEDVPSKFVEKLQIKNITWKYPDGFVNILDNINMTIRKGEAVALVGPSGAGKSTLVDIILGLLVPQKGKILVDGMDVFENKGKWSQMIGFVPQSVYLIDDTIRRNIAFGIDDNQISDDMVWSVLEQAQMKNFVQELAQGLDTLVGERGVRFSGGQAQRLAIARALYTNPDILILDEATSALDIETETAVMEAIDSLHGQKTLIIIAHRLTTIKNCDVIYKIDGTKATKCKYEELLLEKSE